VTRTHIVSVSHVMANRTANCGPSEGVVSGKMSADGPYSSTLQATPRISAPNGEQTQSCSEAGDNESSHV
jgi:hypothetical protein